MNLVTVAAQAFIGSDCERVVQMLASRFLKALSQAGPSIDQMKMNRCVVDDAASFNRGSAGSRTFASIQGALTRVMSS